ncbi:hypothetical protein F2Q68_00043888 [Brassica cretica]|uniref:Uncharacterized protein n=1 Tax=Brassica cretica TaxID=69181 RepID=A0A3N6SIM4_BRACR|nr:hypothetical protein F2Q68_00043888 [Brassica cretica]
MSPFLELGMGHRRLNSNGTALVQIMGFDREQALGASSTKLDGVLEARTSVSVLGGYRAGWLAKDGYGPVGSSGQAMGMGNPCGLVLDMSRSGLTVSGRVVTAIDEWV